MFAASSNTGYTTTAQVWCNPVDVVVCSPEGYIGGRGVVIGTPFIYLSCEVNATSRECATKRSFEAAEAMEAATAARPVVRERRSHVTVGLSVTRAENTAKILRKKLKDAMDSLTSEFAAISAKLDARFVVEDALHGGPLKAKQELEEKKVAAELYLQEDCQKLLLSLDADVAAADTIEKCQAISVNASALTRKLNGDAVSGWKKLLTMTKRLIDQGERHDRREKAAQVEVTTEGPPNPFFEILGCMRSLCHVPSSSLFDAKCGEQMALVPCRAGIDLVSELLAAAFVKKAVKDVELYLRKRGRCTRHFRSRSHRSSRSS